MESVIDDISDIKFENKEDFEIMVISPNNIESYDSVKKCINGLGEEREIFVIGGAQIYKAFFNYANFLHITIINEKTNGIDTFFPVSLSEIKESYRLDNSIKLSNNAEYTYWIKK